MSDAHSFEGGNLAWSCFGIGMCGTNDGHILPLSLSMTQGQDGDAAADFLNEARLSCSCSDI